MVQSFSLQTLLDLMRNRNDLATQRLAALLASEHDAREKLALLLQYRDEYSARFRQAAANGLGQPEWRNYQDFLSRLDEQKLGVRPGEVHQVFASGHAFRRAQRRRWTSTATGWPTHSTSTTTVTASST